MNKEETNRITVRKLLSYAKLSAPKEVKATKPQRAPAPTPNHQIPNRRPMKQRKKWEMIKTQKSRKRLRGELSLRPFLCSQILRAYRFLGRRFWFCRFNVERLFKNFDTQRQKGGELLLMACIHLKIQNGSNRTG